MEITLEEIQRKFESLPEDIRWAIMAAKVDDNVIDIGQLRGLNVPQMGQLSLETHMVMLGFTHPDKFERSLKESLKLSDEKTKQIVGDVNEKILKGIREKLINLPSASVQEKVWKTQETETVSTPPPINPPSERTANTDNAILKQAGIEIMPPLIEGAKPTPTLSFSTAKLNDAFKIPATKTEYTLPSMSKSVEAGADPSKSASAPTPVPKVDPYRMPIE